MKNWEYLAAVAAIAAAVWSRVRIVASWLRGFVVVVTRTDFDAAIMVSAYLERDTTAGSRDRAYSTVDGFVRPLGRVARVAMEHRVAGSRWLRRRRWPIRFAAVAQSREQQSSHAFSFSFIRGTVDWERLLIDAAAWWSSDRAGQDRYQVVHHSGAPRGLVLQSGNDVASAATPVEGGPYIGSLRSPYRLIGWRNEDLGRPMRALEALALPASSMQIVNEARRWHARAAWYRERQIPHRRGYLFKGAPGTGKTSLVRAIAQDLGLPIHVFDLATLTNQELRSAWRRMAACAPCVALVEDIDGVFHGRERVSEGDLTFDALLNVIDGIEQVDGILLAVTTNHPEHVDEALINRPGRVDRVIELEALGPEERRQIAVRILGDSSTARDIADRHAGSPASLVEVCCRKALEGLYAVQETRDADADELPKARSL